MRRLSDLDVKDPAWREIVTAAIARSSVRGLPKPAGLPPEGDLALQYNVYGRHRVVYRISAGKTVTLGSVKDGLQDRIRQQWLARNPLTLESGRQVVVVFENDDPDLPWPLPAEKCRWLTLTPQGATP